jgi:5-methylcytosine-specific restriction protein B
MSFTVPKNLYIIGMMNTADRSLAMIDYALRRRFSFFEMDPGFDSDGFIKYQTALKNDEFNELVEKIKKLNDEIRKDRTLGKGFCIGHSYLCGFAEVDSAQLKDIVDYDILPMLEEYWFDDEAKYQRWANELHGIFQ